MQNRSLVTVNIRNIAVGGDGVGEVVADDGTGEELRGITAFVPYTAPGDIVQARVRAKKARYLSAELTSFERESEDRVTPECSYFGTCGGCELQHISYPGQLRIKEEMIRGALVAAKLPADVRDALRPVVPSSPYNYRRRVHLHIGADGSVGFYRPNSRSIVAIDNCPISRPGINEALKGVRDFGKAVAGKISSLLLEEDGAGVIAVLKSPYTVANNARDTLLQVARKYFDNAVLFAGGVEVGGFGRQMLELPLNRDGKTPLQVPAGAFSQVNGEINRLLLEAAVEAVPDPAGKVVFDLYAGAGNFSLPFARAGARVTAVESDKRLVNIGRQNAQRCRVEKNLSFIESSVERFAANKPRAFPGDVIIADPPRSGLGSLVSNLSGAPQFLLVSCHLPSFVRDLKALVTGGYSVRFIQPFDMFAQTSYSEILCSLVRK